MWAITSALFLTVRVFGFATVTSYHLLTLKSVSSCETFGIAETSVESLSNSNSYLYPDSWRRYRSSVLDFIYTEMRLPSLHLIHIKCCYCYYPADSAKVSCWWRGRAWSSICYFGPFWTQSIDSNWRRSDRYPRPEVPSHAAGPCDLANSL